MRTLNSKTAFITGGASGIGLGMAQALLEQGAKVVIADLRSDHIEAARQRLDRPDAVRFIQLDVTDRDSWVSAADEAEAAFGSIDVLCNNAGIGVVGPAQEASYDDWDWVMAVNVGGVINGLQTILPRMLSRGTEAHIVNTSSISGLLPMPGGIAYVTSKAAVTGLTEALRADLDGSNVGVTLLVPGPHTTNIHQVGAMRPKRYSATKLHAKEAEMEKGSFIKNTLDPLVTGRLVVDAILNGRLFLVTHVDFKDGVARRFAATLAGFPDEPADPVRAASYGYPVTNPLYDELLAQKPPK